MSEFKKHSIIHVGKGAGYRAERNLVEEFPLKLVVNGRTLATLISSPHQLHHLVAGFFRLQGFIRSLDDFLTLGICAEQGVAEVRIRGEFPEQLQPTLTSGCGTGISFELPAAPAVRRPAKSFTSQAVFSLMREMSRRAEHYASHGGIHSAAVGDGETLLHAEDIGRHNTLDRIAGEALFRGIDLEGTMLATSGRISTEMVVKAARLGISVIASRTSPTDMAVSAAEDAGITVAGYVRAGSFEIFSHAERIRVEDTEEKVSGVTGVILAGGESRRMGSNKSLLPIAGARFIDHAFRCLSGIFEEVLIVTNSPELYADLPCRKVPDLYPLQGSLAGITPAFGTRAMTRFLLSPATCPSSPHRPSGGSALKRRAKMWSSPGVNRASSPCMPSTTKNAFLPSKRRWRRERGRSTVSSRGSGRSSWRTSSSPAKTNYPFAISIRPVNTSPFVTG